MYLGLLLLAAWVVCIILDAAEVIAGDSFLEIVPPYLVLLAITYPFFRRRYHTSRFQGTVAHLRQWYPPQGPKPKASTGNWAFDLQRTDSRWRPLHDVKGFLAPVLEVAYTAAMVHGPPLEEGSRVAVRGQNKEGLFFAREVWNLTPPVEIGAEVATGSYYGRVIDLQAPSQVADSRYPDGRYLEVRSFRLQPTDTAFSQLLRDAQGNLAQPIPVEIRARVISGPLQEGDKVEVYGQVARGMLYASEVRNQSAGGAALVIRDRAALL